MGDIWPYGPPAYVTWTQAYTEMLSLGQSQEDAAVYAAIGSAESSLDLTVINDTPGTGDYSVGIWQINYYGSLYSSRAAAYGTPQQLIAGGLTKQAIAAMEVGRGGFGPWSTYTNGAYLKYLNGFTAPTGGGGTGAPPTISEGSSGAYVSQLQTDLNKLGYGLAVDGSFGPLTRAAVVAFQTAQRISVDGVVGPQTWQALANAIGFATGGNLPGPTTIPGTAPPPPNEPPGNVDPSTIGEWSNLVSISGPELGAQLVTLNGYGNSIGGL